MQCEHAARMRGPPHQNHRLGAPREGGGGVVRPPPEQEPHGHGPGPGPAATAAAEHGTDFAGHGGGEMGQDGGHASSRFVFDSELRGTGDGTTGDPATYLRFLWMDHV